MARSTHKRGQFRLPSIQPGDWHGEILPGGSVNLGQTIQEGPPRRTVELSYITLPASMHSANRDFRWPGVIMIMAPTPMRVLQSDAGALLKSEDNPSLMLSLEVTRGQFADMLRLLEAKRLQTLHFSIEAPSEAEIGRWSIRSWGMTAELTDERRAP